MNQDRLNSNIAYLTESPNNLPPPERFAFRTFCFSQRCEGEARVFCDEALPLRALREGRLGGTRQRPRQQNDGDLETLASLG